MSQQKTNRPLRTNTRVPRRLNPIGWNDALIFHQRLPPARWHFPVEHLDGSSCNLIQASAMDLNNVISEAFSSAPKLLLLLPDRLWIPSLGIMKALYYTLRLLVIINCRFYLQKQYSTGFHRPAPNVCFFPHHFLPCFFFPFFPARTTAVWCSSFESYGKLYLLLLRGLLEWISIWCSVKATPPVLPDRPPYAPQLCATQLD